MQIGEDDISRKLGMIKCEDPESNNIIYVKIDNGKIKKYDGCRLAEHIIIDGRIMHIENDEFVEGISDSITSIGSDAFNNCTSIKSITIPDSVTSIGYGAFDSCSSLTSITIPDSVTRIGSNAFYNCPSLTSITIPDSVTDIGRHTFY